MLALYQEAQLQQCGTGPYYLDEKFDHGNVTVAPVGKTPLSTPHFGFHGVSGSEVSGSEPSLTTRRI